MNYKNEHYINLREGLDELADYLHKDRGLVWSEFEKAAIKNPDKYIKFIEWSDKEWERNVSNPNNPEQVNKYWENTESHLYVLTEANHTKPQRNLAATIIEHMKNDNFKTILDFGSGTGENVIDYFNSGLSPVALDVKGLVADFSRWRFKKRKLNIPLFHSINEIPSSKNFDAISCIEVFQHLVDPPAIIRQMKKILKIGGKLYTTYRFKNNYKPALNSNFNLEEKFDMLMDNNKFVKLDRLHLWGKGESSKYLHIYQNK